MGDPRRFDLFGHLISQQFPERSLRIADVAGGRGFLQANLRQQGYGSIVSWDKRKGYSKGRPGYRWGWFDHRSAPPDYNLVIGMHPDEGTDQIIRYAATHRVPFCICPCCVKPTAEYYRGPAKFHPWVEHLTQMAQRYNFSVETHLLKMNGRNLVLIWETIVGGTNVGVRSNQHESCHH